MGIGERGPFRYLPVCQGQWFCLASAGTGESVLPLSLASCCKYLLFPLCHGRGRDFESRRPRQLFPNVYVAFLHFRRNRITPAKVVFPTFSQLSHQTARLPNSAVFLRVHGLAFGTFKRFAELFEVLHRAVDAPACW